MSELSACLPEARRYEACDDARGNLSITRNETTLLTPDDYCHCEASAHTGCGNPFSYPARRQSLRLLTLNS